MNSINDLGRKAKKASKKIAVAGEEKNKALKAIAEALINKTNDLVSANKIDIKNAKNNGLTDAFIDRLTLSDERIKMMSEGIFKIISFEDPIGRVLEGHVTKEGLHINNVSVPIGVIGIIYESRPNVTVDAAALCLKAGKAF